MKRKKKLSLGSAIVLLIVALLFTAGDKNKNKEPVPQYTEEMLSVHYIDVGQGDSIFISFPNGESMLIDAGENDYGEAVCDYIASCGENKIDYLVGTHPHSDHIGGLDTVIERFDIGKLYLPNISHDTKTFMDVVSAAKEKSVETIQAKAGVSICNQNGVAAKLLSPVSAKYEDMNNYSAVVSVTYQDISFLFTGDAEYIVENELKSTISHYDVLKVGHHGSNSSTTANFLEKVKPRYAVISCGTDNSYGHPHAQVTNRLQRFGCEIYRTDMQGTVVAQCDGNQITFETER